LKHEEEKGMGRTLLLVDDERPILGSLQRSLRQEGYNICGATSPVEGLQVLSCREVGVVISDLTMPEMDGIAFLREAGRLSPDTIRILLTGNGNLENAMDAVNRLHVFGYLTKPWVSEEIRRTIRTAFDQYDLTRENKRLLHLTQEQNHELQRFNSDLEEVVQERSRQIQEAVRESIRMLAFAAEAKDDDTGLHVQRIQDLTLRICKSLGIPPGESQKIGFFSSMHDIGKIHVPDAILKKRGSLTEQEWIVMKAHTLAGFKILGTHPFYQTAREIARNHHERWDGGGYPDGLSRENIPLPGRIVAVADVFDALTHARPYKEAWPVERALEEMERLSGKAFDPEILEVFLRKVDPVRLGGRKE
jgi:putative two-component system response regulator